MPFFIKLLHALTRTRPTRGKVELQLAERTQKAIKRYDEMLNANAKKRQELTQMLDRQNTEG